VKWLISMLFGGQCSCCSSALRTATGGILGAMAGLSGLSSSPGPVKAVTETAGASILPDDAYTLLGGEMKSCKVLNGEGGT